MKNVEEVFSKRPMFRMPMQGAPPPKGWAVKYVSGMEDKPDIKPGFWLSRFYVDRQDTSISTLSLCLICVGAHPVITNTARNALTSRKAI